MEEIYHEANAVFQPRRRFVKQKIAFCWWRMVDEVLVWLWCWRGVMVMRCGVLW
jgi:hypothetical protein